MDNVGRNDPCPCGSGKKYKKCCESKNSPQKTEPKKLTADRISSVMQGTTNLSQSFFKRNVQPISPTETQAKDLKITKQS